MAGADSIDSIDQSTPGRDLARLVRAEDRARIDQLTQDPPAATLIICHGPGAHAGARTLADALTVHGDHPVALSPADERWRLPELRSELAASLSHHPQRRHIVHLQEANTINAAGFDQLLLTVEDPPSAAWIIIDVHDLRALPATVRGRAGQQLAFGVSSRDVRADYLEHLGVSLSAADALLDATPHSSSFEMLLADASDPAALAASLATLTSLTLTSAAPATRAFELTSATLEAAAMLPSKQRARAARRITATMCQVAEGRVNAAVRARDDRATFARAAVTLAALPRAAQLLAANAPISAVYLALCAPPDERA